MVKKILKAFKISEVRATIILLLIMHYSLLTTQAQNFSFYTEGGQSGQAVGIVGNYSINSNILTAKFINTLYKGGKLDDATKDKASKRLGKNNRFGGDVGYGLFYIQHPKRSDSTAKVGYFVALNWKANLSASFSKDLFNWVFQGNKDYAGTKSYLGGSKFNLMTWRELQGGLLWEKKKGKVNIRSGITLSVLQGRALFNARLTQLEVDMDSLGYALDVTSKIGVSASAPNRHFTDGRAYGGAIGGFLITEYEKGTFKFEVNDLGALFFDKNTQQITNEGKFHWEGYKFNSFKGIGDSIANFVKVDALKTKYQIKEDRQAATMLMPAWFKLAYEFKLPKNQSIEFGLMERITYGWFPYLYSHYNLQATPGFRFGARLSYGGYGGLSVGLYLDKKFGKNFAASIGSNTVEGFVLSKVANGQGVFLNLRGMF